MSRQVLHFEHLSHCTIMWTSSLLILLSHMSMTLFIALCLSSSADSSWFLLLVDINVMFGSEQRQLSEKPTSLLHQTVPGVLVQGALLSESWGSTWSRIELGIFR